MKNPNAPQKNRVALIYGSNGSGKSTIAQGFREYAESVIPKTVELNPTAGAAIIKMSSGMKSGKIFVFDEKDISRNIKVQESGLGTIVLLGEQVELEKRLEELKAQIAKLQANIDSKAENVEKFNLVSDVISPEYWKAAITKKLQSSGGWAETSGIRIKRNQIKTRVTDAEVDRLGQLTPQKDETLTREKFTELFSVFDSIETSVSPVAPEIRAIDIPEKVVEDAKRLLAKVPQKPILTEREQELLHFFGIEVLSNAKGFLSVKTHEICPTCLQMISEEHRTKSLQQIEDILNREVEECREELKKLILPEIEAEHYQCYSVLDSELLGQIILQIASVNALITNYNKVIQSKIADPLSPVECVSSEDLITAYKQLNNLLGRLEIKRESFNRVITNRKTTEKELLKLNDEIAHYVIYTEYQSLLSQRSAKQTAEEELHQLIQAREDHVKEQQFLDAQRKNLQIAVEQINKSLSYIFYSDSRLKLHLENDQMYHLTVNGKDVFPDKISCGERNALALCYFFSEIAKETELQKLYHDEMFVVIDDPVSSFDVENRVGILSFLRYKLNQMLSACATTKVLMMSHDVSVIFDLQKVIEETIDPELTIDRALETYLKKGYTREWINQRLQAIQVRKELTDEWDARGVQKGVEYAILTDEISRAWSGMSTRQYKNLKGLKKENLRDNMTTLELVLNMLAEATTTQFSKDRKPTTFQENLAVAKAGGQVAGRTRKDIESQSNMPIISPKNAVQLNQVITDLLEDATSDLPKKADDK